ncbi:MAG: cation diffusion facilitator family transporter [Chthoniobacterales bacterium]
MSSPLHSLHERSRDARRAVIISLSANVVFAFGKIFAAILGHSQALLADGIESLLDIVSSGFVWGALKYGAKPPDDNHPYGHGKIESLAGVACSLLLLLAGVLVGAHSLREIFLTWNSESGYQSAHPAPFTMVVLLVVIVGKEFLFRFILHHGKKAGSTAMEIDAWHHRSDALTSIAAFIGIGIALIGGEKYASADGWAALFSCLIIAYNGLKMMRKSIAEMMDESVSEEIISHVYEIACLVPGVLRAEKCRVRKSGLSLLADLHIQVDGDCTVREGHDISHRVKDRLLESDLPFTDVTVHLEPIADSSDYSPKRN